MAKHGLSRVSYATEIPASARHPAPEKLLHALTRWGGL